MSGRVLPWAAGVALAALAAAAPAASADCRDAQAAPAGLTQSESADAVECEINRRRRARDRPALEVHARLRDASARHAGDMVRRGYFSHVGADGRTMTARLRDAGYLRGGRSWAAGEVLAWGTGGHSTAEGIVTEWMHSAPHRRVLLSRRYVEVGVGVALGTPMHVLPAGATYAAALGFVDR